MNILTEVALRTIYPDHTWTNASHKSFGYWKDLNNQRKFFDDLAVKLHITKPEDWYSVSTKTLLEHDGSFIKTYYGSLIQGTGD